MEEIIGSNKYFLEEPYFIYDFFFRKQGGYILVGKNIDFHH